MLYLKRAAVIAVVVLAASAATAETVMMSDEWAAGMCAAWNQEVGLTANLDGWIANDGDRGYKIMRIYRRDCAESPWIELRVARSDAGVVCVDSGWAGSEELTDADYVMFADTRRWLEMGAGEYGPMGGMMTGRLKFQGPKWEAMKNMGPFKNFLLLVGKVPGTTDSCPAVAVEAASMDESMPEAVPERPTG